MRTALLIGLDTTGSTQRSAAGEGVPGQALTSAGVTLPLAESRALEVASSSSFDPRSRMYFFPAVPPVLGVDAANSSSGYAGLGCQFSHLSEQQLSLAASWLCAGWDLAMADCMAQQGHSPESWSAEYTAQDDVRKDQLWARVKATAFGAGEWAADWRVRWNAVADMLLQ